MLEVTTMHTTTPLEADCCPVLCLVLDVVLLLFFVFRYLSIDQFCFVSSADQRALFVLSMTEFTYDNTCEKCMRLKTDEKGRASEAGGERAMRTC